jgi:hypothetical protein
MSFSLVHSVLAQNGEVVRRFRMTAFMSPRKGVLGLGEAVLLGEQHPHLERSTGVAALVGADICVDGAVDIPPVLKHPPERVRGFRNPQLVGPVVGGLSPLHVAAMRQQHAEVECSGVVTALMRPGKGLLGLHQLVVLGQQHRQLECPVGIAALIGADIRSHRPVDVSSLLEQDAELQSSAGVTALVRVR